MSDNLNVSGVDISHNLRVEGTSTFKDNVTINNNLDVSGVDISNTLIIPRKSGGNYIKKVEMVVVLLVKYIMILLKINFLEIMIMRVLKNLGVVVELGEELSVIVVMFLYFLQIKEYPNEASGIYFYIDTAENNRNSDNAIMSLQKQDNNNKLEFKGNLNLLRTVISIKSITCGNGHTAILTTHGTVLTFGNNSFGQLGNGTSGGQTNPPAMVLSDEDSTYNGSNCQAIACGHYHTAILTTHGTVLTFGYNSYGQLGNGTSGVTQIYLLWFCWGL